MFIRFVARSCRSSRREVGECARHSRARPLKAHARSVRVVGGYEHDAGRFKGALEAQHRIDRDAETFLAALNSLYRRNADFGAAREFGLIDSQKAAGGADLIRMDQFDRPLPPNGLTRPPSRDTKSIIYETFRISA